MHKATIRTTLGMVALVAAAAACAQDPAWVGEARKVATSVPPRLLAVLTEEMAKGGPEGAILVCRDKAPELARAASEETGWDIRRVSLRNRNPKAVPDAWERAALGFRSPGAAGGEMPATLEKAEVVTEDGKQFYRYMRALPTQELCLNCHGLPERRTPAVKERLKALPGSGEAGAAGPVGQWQVSNGGGSDPRWRADGRELFFVGADGSMMAVPIAVRGATLEAGTPVALFPAARLGGANIQYDVTTDGKFLINGIVGDAVSTPLVLVQHWAPEAKP